MQEAPAAGLTWAALRRAPPAGASTGEDDSPDELTAAQFDAVVARHHQPAHELGLQAVAHAAQTHGGHGQRRSAQHLPLLVELLLMVVVGAGGRWLGKCEWVELAELRLLIRFSPRFFFPFSRWCFRAPRLLVVSFSFWLRNLRPKLMSCHNTPPCTTSPTKPRLLPACTHVTWVDDDDDDVVALIVFVKSSRVKERSHYWEHLLHFDGRYPLSVLIIIITDSYLKYYYQSSLQFYYIDLQSQTGFLQTQRTVSQPGYCCP